MNLPGLKNWIGVPTFVHMHCRFSISVSSTPESHIGGFEQAVKLGPMVKEV
jgi:hypothetical protein